MDKPKTSLRTTALLIAIAMLVVAVAAFAYPYTRRTETVKRVGQAGVDQLEALAISLSYYAHEDIVKINLEKTISEEFKQISHLLHKVKQQRGLERLYIVVKTAPSGYLYIADSDYRDNGVQGTDYMSPQDQYPMDVYQAGRSAMEQIFGGKSTSGHTGSLITTPDQRKAVSAYLPLTAPDGRVIALLGADLNPGDVSFQRIGFIDLKLLGISALMVAAIGLLLWYLLGKWQAHKAKKQASREQVAQEQEADLVQPTAEEEAPLLLLQDAQAAPPEEQSPEEPLQ